MANLKIGSRINYSSEFVRLNTDLMGEFSTIRNDRLGTVITVGLYTSIILWDDDKRPQIVMNSHIEEKICQD